MSNTAERRFAQIHESDENYRVDLIDGEDVHLENIRTGESVKINGSFVTFYPFPNGHMTRTELGYAFWKEDLQTVAEARVQAMGRIAARKIGNLIRKDIEAMSHNLNKLFGGRKS